MAEKTFHLRYGKGIVSFQIPESQLLYELNGKEYPPLPDVEKAYREALEKPYDSPPLREMVRPGERVVVTVSDITRGWQRNDRVLPALLETLNEAGVPDGLPLSGHT